MYELPLREISSIQTGPFGSQLHKKDYQSKGAPIVTVEHLGEKKFSTQNLPCVSESDKTRLRKYVLQRGDIVFSRVGSVDRSSFVSESESGWLFSGRCLRIRPNEQIINPEYLYYYLNLPNIKKHIRNIAVGATMPSINTKILSNVIIKFPEIDIQNKIAHNLSILDEKIDINNNIINNLESQAQLIVLSALRSEKTRKLEDYAFINPKRPLKKGANARYIDMSSISTTNAIPTGYEYKEYSGGVKFSNGDSLLARITPCLENGKAAFINFLEKEEVAFGSTEFISFHTKGILPDEFFYCLLRTKDFRQFAIKHLTGTSGRQRVSAKDIASYPLPDFNLLEINRLNKYLPDLFNSITSHKQENDVLSKIRDFLLPKIMIGEPNQISTN